MLFSESKLIHPGDKRSEELGHLSGGPIGGYNHIVRVVYEIIGKMISFIRNDRHAEYTDATMARHDDLRHNGAPR